MSSRRYAEDGVRSAVINYIISGVFFIAGTVFMILLYSGQIQFTSLSVLFLGMALANLANVKAVYKDYELSNKFVRILLTIGTILGALMILGAVVDVALENTANVLPYVKVAVFSVLIGSIIKIIVTNISDFTFGTFENPTSDFFRHFSWLIFIAGTLAFFSIMDIFFDFYFILLFVGNWLLVYFFFITFREWMETKNVSNLIWTIILFLIGVGLNLPMALAVNGMASSQFDITQANLFNLAANLYYALAFVMGIGFCFLTRLTFVQNSLTEKGVAILFMVIPLLAFGVQFLAFFYFDVFLIVAGVTLVLVALVVLLFKVVVTVVKWLGAFFVEAVEKIWYIISFKWIRNQKDYFGPSSISARSSRSQGSTGDDYLKVKQCSRCRYCVCDNPLAGNDDPDAYQCTCTGRRFSYNDSISGGCDKFEA